MSNPEVIESVPERIPSPVPPDPNTININLKIPKPSETFKSCCGCSVLGFILFIIIGMIGSCSKDKESTPQYVPAPANASQTSATNVSEETPIAKPNSDAPAPTPISNPSSNNSSTIAPAVAAFAASQVLNNVAPPTPNPTPILYTNDYEKQIYQDLANAVQQRNAVAILRSYEQAKATNNMSAVISELEHGGWLNWARSNIPAAVPKESPIAQYTPAVSSQAAYTEPAASDRSSETVYITRTGKKYHRASCRHLKSNAGSMSISVAQSRGYGACSVCF
jgi:hypothetical protein